MTHFGASHAEKFQLTRLQLFRNAITQWNKSGEWRFTALKADESRLTSKMRKKAQQGRELWRKRRGLANNHESSSGVTWELWRSENLNFFGSEYSLFYEKVTCVLKNCAQTHPAVYSIYSLSSEPKWKFHRKKNGKVLCRSRSSPEKFLRSLAVRLRHAQRPDKPIIRPACAASPINPKKKRPHFPPNFLLITI